MRHLPIFVLVAGLSMAPSVVQAQAGAPQRPATPSAPLKPSPPQTPAATPAQSSPNVAMSRDARRAGDTQPVATKSSISIPPSVREVLRIDPTLLYRADYIGNYPVLAAFLQQHPEMAHNPAFFIGECQLPSRAQSRAGGYARSLRKWSNSSRCRR